MSNVNYDFGMIGLGTMGRNLVLNMAEHGFSVAGYDKNAAQVETLKKDAEQRLVMSTDNLAEFIGSLSIPRKIILLVPAGKIVDNVIEELVPLLSPGDLLMDFGNSHFTDTDRRAVQMQAVNMYFMGVGISGGESGARYGPSMMPGGPAEAYEQVASMLESVAAKVNNEPCVTWLGPGSAGHYVKMVHNGIEYGIMQLIAESYHLLKVIGKLNNDELHQVYSSWNNGRLHSFLLEITAAVFVQNDELSPNRLVDMILDSAKQKGTGGWTSQDAIDLQVPVPVIDMAVSMRDLSAYKKERETAAELLNGPVVKLSDEKKELISFLEQALYFSMVTVYAQGMAQLSAASEKYDYGLKPELIAKIWRGGCIIRASLLEDIHAAFLQQPALSNLMLDKNFADKLSKSQNGIRNVIRWAVEDGIPVAAFMASLGYYDNYRSSWMPANLIQAQRDYFGAHTYERIDREGTFHTHWNQPNT